MYPYTQNTGTLIAVVKAIGKNGIPAKFTTKELPIWGFKSSNDRPVIGVMRALGFIDNSGTPTDLWKKARASPELAIAKGARTAYADLFQMFPDADRKDSESLTNFFKARTSVGDAAVRNMVATFKAIAAYGKFDQLDQSSPAGEKVADKVDNSGINGTGLSIVKTSKNGLVINLNIELSLPIDATGDVYDKFFTSMKKHIIDA